MSQLAIVSEKSVQHLAWVASRARLSVSQRPRPQQKPSSQPRKARLYNHSFSAHVTDYLRRLCNLQASEIRRLKDKEFLRTRNLMPVFKNLEKNSEKITGIAWPDLISANRGQRYAWARHVCFYLLNKYTVFSAYDIGRRMGGRNHTTILHGIWCVEASLGEGEWPAGVKPRTYHNLLKSLEELIK